MNDYKAWSSENLNLIEGQADEDDLRDAVVDYLRDLGYKGKALDIDRATALRAFHKLTTETPSANLPGWTLPGRTNEIRRLLLAFPGIKSKDLGSALDIPEYVVRGIKADMTKERRETVKLGANEYETYEQWACDDF